MCSYSIKLERREHLYTCPATHSPATPARRMKSGLRVERPIGITNTYSPTGSGYRQRHAPGIGDVPQGPEPFRTVMDTIQAGLLVQVTCGRLDLRWALHHADYEVFCLLHDLFLVLRPRLVPAAVISELPNGGRTSAEMKRSGSIAGLEL